MKIKYVKTPISLPGILLLTNYCCVGTLFMYHFILCFPFGFNIQGVSTSRDKVGVLVDKLLSTHDPLAFPTFLRVLNSRYPEVMDVLRLELHYQQVS